MISLFKEYFFRTEEEVMKSFFTVPIASSQLPRTLKNYVTTQGEVNKCTNPLSTKYCSAILIPDIQLEENLCLNWYENCKLGIQQV